MARSKPGEKSQFEPGVVQAKPAAVEMPAAEVFAEVKRVPRAILLEEPIGWMEGGVLCAFRQEQLVTNPADIKRLIQHGAQYSELK